MAGLDEGERVVSSGVPLANAHAAAILLHGRGASPEDILYSMAPALDVPGLHFLAPAAPDNAWYPQPFTAPLEQNEPWLSSALGMLDRLVAHVERYVPAEKLVLLGFSQGACLALEYTARRARRYGGIVGFSGALIGPPGTPRDYAGSLHGTPVLLASSDPDPYVSADLVREAGAVLQRLGGEVTVHLYPDMGHTISPAEIGNTRGLMAALTRREEEVSI